VYADASAQGCPPLAEAREWWECRRNDPTVIANSWLLCTCCVAMGVRDNQEST
jgi:hypothetical protein